MISKKDAKQKDKQAERREAQKALKAYLRGRPVYISEGLNRERRRMKPQRYSLLWAKIVRAARFRGIRLHRRNYTNKQLTGLYSWIYPNSRTQKTFGFGFK